MATKQQLEDEFSALDDSLNTLLEALRADGRCVLCNADQGKQHATSCVVWPFIMSRATRSGDGVGPCST
jgi:hypothetical protein